MDKYSAWLNQNPRLVNDVLDPYSDKNRNVTIESGPIVYADSQQQPTEPESPEVRAALDTNDPLTAKAKDDLEMGAYTSEQLDKQKRELEQVQKQTESSNSLLKWQQALSLADDLIEHDDNSQDYQTTDSRLSGNTVQVDPVRRQNSGGNGWAGIKKAARLVSAVYTYGASES